MNVLEPWNIFYLVSFLIYGYIRRVYFNKTREEKKETS